MAELVVLGAIPKQAKQPRKSHPVSSTSRACISSCLQIPALTSLSDRLKQLKQILSPSCFWSWQFITTIVTLNKTKSSIKVFYNYTIKLNLECLNLKNSESYITILPSCVFFRQLCDEHCFLSKLMQPLIAKRICIKSILINTSQKPLSGMRKVGMPTLLNLSGLDAECNFKNVSSWHFIASFIVLHKSTS